MNKNEFIPDPVLPLCLMCECKSADCAYGNLRGGQSCYDNYLKYTRDKKAKEINELQKIKNEIKRLYGVLQLGHIDEKVFINLVMQLIED